jgi:hypothetical protein
MSVWGKAAGGGAWADHVEEEEAAGDGLSWELSGAHPPCSTPEPR